MGCRAGAGSPIERDLDVPGGLEAAGQVEVDALRAGRAAVERVGEVAALARAEIVHARRSPQLRQPGNDGLAGAARERGSADPARLAGEISGERDDPLLAIHDHPQLVAEDRNAPDGLAEAGDERAPAGVVQLPQIGGHRLVRRHPVERREGGEMLAGSVRWAEVRSRLARRRLQEGGKAHPLVLVLPDPGPEQRRPQQRRLRHGNHGERIESAALGARSAAGGAEQRRENDLSHEASRDIWESKRVPEASAHGASVKPCRGSAATRSPLLSL